MKKMKKIIDLPACRSASLQAAKFALRQPVE
jgi:hypothetical protein